MALLDLCSVFYDDLKFLLAVFSFAAYKNTGTISCLAVLFRHFIPTPRAFNFYFFQYLSLSRLEKLPFCGNMWKKESEFYGLPKMQKRKCVCTSSHRCQNKAPRLPWLALVDFIGHLHFWPYIDNTSNNQQQNKIRNAHRGCVSGLRTSLEGLRVKHAGQIPAVKQSFRNLVAFLLFRFRSGKCVLLLHFLVKFPFFALEFR